MPGSRFTYDPATGLPGRRPAPADRRRAVPVRDLPRPSLQAAVATRCSTATACSASRGEVGGGSTARLRERGFSPCAVDWWGLSIADLPNVALTLADRQQLRRA